MENFDRLIVCETDKGNFAVRPLNWAGCWNSDGKIKECGLNHIAVFHYKEDAEWYANTKNAEEQGLLLRLPCKVGDTIYNPVFEYYRGGELIKEPFVIEAVVKRFGFVKDELTIVTKNGIELREFFTDSIGKTVFLTREEAEKALADMGV